MLPVMVADMGAGQRPRQARPLHLLAGQKLDYVRLGHAIVLSFSGGQQVVIETVAQPFRASWIGTFRPGHWRCSMHRSMVSQTDK